MIKDFMGQVKVADIQSAFDEIVERINRQVDIYNDAAGYSDIDYTKGSPKLSNVGYTLSIGGLKSVINAYNNTLIGCKAYKLNDTAVLVSSGLYFKNGQIYRINSRVISGQEGWDLSDLYYDIDNDVVMFKDGTEGSIVDVQTGWTQPTINSNTLCGIFTANYNSQDAYKITTSEGFNASWQGSGEFAYPSVTWNFPKSIKISNISLNVSDTVFLGNATIVVLCDQEEVYRGAAGQLNLNLSNRNTQSITVLAQISDNSLGFSVNFKNLIITGLSNSYAIDAGGVITPSDNIIKICHLNWSSNELILNSIEGFQLEGNKGVALVSQNRGISQAGMNDWDNLDTSSSGKFVAYLSPFSNANMSYSGHNIFMGLHVTGAEASNNNYQRMHYVSAPISLIYIPKGATIIDSRIMYGSRNVFNSELKK